MSALGWATAGFVFWFLYGSFFEWWFHKYMFHSPKIHPRPFKHHTMIHHQIYKFEMKSYEWNPPREKDHITMDWWALPLFLISNAPFVLGVQWLVGWTMSRPTWIGGFIAIATYYAIYEYFHYAMHVPDGQFFQKTKIFNFVKEHHRVHHKYMLHNLNVFFPLADLVMGTYRTETTPARIDRNKGRNRDKAIAATIAKHDAQNRTAPGAAATVTPLATAGTTAETKVPVGSAK